MHTEVIKWLSIPALPLAIVFWPSAAPHQSELNILVWVAVAVVLTQAFQAKKYSWAAGLLGIMLLFNAAVPLFRLTGAFGLALAVVAIAPLAVSLVAPLPALERSK